MGVLKTLGCFTAMLLLVRPSLAAERTFIVVTNEALVGHWPGEDGWLGTADDPVDGNPSEGVGSDPDRAGTYGFMTTLLTFFPTDPDPYLFDAWNTVTFIQGAARIDPEAFLADGVPLLTAVEIHGTQLFQGHGYV